jgi:hypothetical protein
LRWPVTLTGLSSLSSASRRTRILGSERFLDVPDNFLDGDLGSVTRLLEIRIDDVPPVSMRLMGLAASTGHTHLLPPSALPEAGFGLPGRPASETCRGDGHEPKLIGYVFGVLAAKRLADWIQNRRLPV